MNDQQNQQQELDLRSYLLPVWRRKWIVLAIVVVATAATYFISSSQQNTYVATTKLYVQVADPTQNIANPAVQAALSGQALADVAQLLTAQGISSAVSRTLGMPASTAGSVTTTADPGSDFVTITATSHKQLLAARLANLYVSTFLHSRQRAVVAEAIRGQNAVQATLASLPGGANSLSDATERQTLLQQLQTYKEIQLNPSAGARQINPAAVPHQASSPQPKRDAIFGGVVGFVLAVIVAYCLELLDRRLVRVSSVESIYGLPVLAVLPHVTDPTPLAEGQQAMVPARFLEELRTLRVMLRLSGDGEPPRTIIVTSTLPREGKSTVTRDLALVYAEAGERVLVIDGDLRRPSMERLFGLAANGGLVQVLRGEAPLREFAVPVVVPLHAADASTNGDSAAALANGHPRLNGSVDVLAHGERVENPLALLSAERMVEVLEEASQAYDVVLLDTAPVLAVADAVPLLENVDSVLLVARLGQATRESADRFKGLISRLSNVPVSGVIANDRRDDFDDEGYGSYGRYGYGYYYGAKHHASEQKPATTAS